MKTVSVSEFAKAHGIPFQKSIDRAPDSGRRLTLKFLGTAGFILETEGRTLVMDPYVSRPNFLQHVFGRLTPNRDLVLKTIPRCHEVLIGHSHSDHLLDAPTLAIEYGARIIGTETTSAIAGAAARAAGVEIETLVTNGGEDIQCGPVTIRGIPSAHAPVVPNINLGKFLGNGVPFPGKITEDEGRSLKWPLNVSAFKEGGDLDWLITASGLRILHIDSAKFIESELDALEIESVDVLCLCAIGWQKGNDNYLPYLLKRFRPRIVVPCHWDVLFDPYRHPQDQETRVWGLSQLDLFLKEIAVHVEGSEVILLDFDGVLTL